MFGRLARNLSVAQQGKEIKPQRGKPVVVPSEMQSVFKKNKKAAKAFEELTLGKQREYTEYVAEAKREETKIKRLAKILPMIASGIGLNDKYR